MKKFFLIIIFIGLLLSFWQCSEINPLEIEQIVSALKQPTEKPDIGRNDYTSNGNFLPGYQNGKIRSDRVILSWLANTDADFLCYKIFRNNVDKATIMDESTITHIDSNLSQNTYYNYKIVTMNKSGMYQSDTIRLKTPQFLAPNNLGYQVRSSASIKLFWNNMAESANDFKIFRKLYSEPVSAYQEVGTSSDTSYIDNTVTNLEQYNYRISAYNNYESTGYSYDLYVYVNYILNMPTLYSVNQVSGVRSVMIEWNENNSNAEDGFLIYRRKTGQNLQLIGTVPTNFTEYVDNDTTNSLKIDSTYYYTVRAYNAANNDTSDYSNQLGVTISVASFIEIGSGSISWAYPFYTLYHDSRTQIIYSASEIGQSMTIRKIAFNITQIPGQIMNNFVIRMKHTSLSSYSSTNFDNTGYVLCLNTNLNITTTGWVDIPLTNNFTYNGINNLIIDVSIDNSSWTSEGLCFASDTFINRSIYNFSDSGLGYPLYWISGNQSTYVPNIRLYSSY